MERRKSLHRSPRNRFRTRGLATTSAALGGISAAAVTNQADATIIYDITTTHSMGSIIQLDGTAFSAIEIAAGMMGQTTVSLDSPNGGMMGTSSTVEFAFETSGGTRFLEDLSLWDEVGTTQAYNGQAYLVRNGDFHPDWAVGQTALVGFTFEAGGTATQYGWVRLTFDSNTSASIDQWAYDDTGAPIAAGVIPEPGTALLLGAGLAILGGACSRRRDRHRPLHDD